MAKAVVIEQSEALTPLGNLTQTVDNLCNGTRALRPGPCFGVPVAYAPFEDESNRDLSACAKRLATGVDLRNLPCETTAFLYGSAKGDIRAMEAAVGGAHSCDVSPLLDNQADMVCSILGLRPCRTLVISNACASGVIALEVAKELLESGSCTHAVVFGFDCISRFVATGFLSLGALSPLGSRPFDAKRDGLSLGEAAAIAVLSRRDPAPGDIVVSGAGSSNDANHRTGPSRTGEGLYRAAAAALADAQIDPLSIGAVKCHGTATAYNDAMEAKAIHRLFGDACPPCASFKGAMGHTSGAGSLMEILAAARCLKNRVLPPTAGYAEHGVEEKLALSAETQVIGKPAMLCLSAGFGGVNAAAVLTEVHA